MYRDYMLSYCSKCRRFKENINFFEREDRPGFYSWCKDCMDKGARSKDYPKKRDRGDGKIG